MEQKKPIFQEDISAPSQMYFQASIGLPLLMILHLSPTTTSSTGIVTSTNVDSKEELLVTPRHDSRTVYDINTISDFLPCVRSTIKFELLEEKLIFSTNKSCAKLTFSARQDKELGGTSIK
ncbi:hypothetical protein AB6A40_005010 [Gnathostoma spinigerum]|uniref:Uncharacterized protein n=1 Tax=Gnathostoma spinigerum TaxID=75299 RepID=A0ABD6EGH1_9BILA